MLLFFFVILVVETSLRFTAGLFRPGVEDLCSSNQSDRRFKIYEACDTPSPFCLLKFDRPLKSIEIH